jgi:hypothetical protein
MGYGGIGEAMPYWSIYCVFCSGFVQDELLECVPDRMRSEVAFRRLLKCEPGAALACPYCGGLLGFDDDGKSKIADSGWPVYRYGLEKLEEKKVDDGETAMSLTDWALKHRFLQPGTHLPFTDYTYAEHAPPNEIVP